MKEIRNSLIITYNFPPMGGTGVQRVKSLVKYLPFYGVVPIVLTINNRDDRLEVDQNKKFFPDIDLYDSFCLDFYTIYRMMNISSWNDKYREAISIYSERENNLRTRIVDMYNKMMVPDAKLFWLPFAVKKAKSIFSKHKIDALFSTSPYATAHLIAYSISKKYNIPMICDFRDPWTQGKIEITRPFPFKNIDIMLERMIINHSSKVISVTEEMKQDFRCRYKNLNKKKFVVVTNGFDPEEFQGAEPYQYDHFTILYAGKNYEGQGNIPSFLDKLNKIRKNLKIDIFFHYIGSDHQVVASYAKSNSLNFVKVTQFSPRFKVINHMKGANLLYLYQHGERIPPLTGKLFEYLAAQRPIIAMTKEHSELAQIIAKTKSGISFELNEDYKLEAFIKKEYAIYCKRRSPKLLKNDELIAEYDRKALTGKIADIIHNVTEP